MAMSDEAKAELAEAVRILKEDGIHIHKTYAAFQKTLEQPPTDPATDPPKDGDPPPPKPDPTPTPKKKSLWWGERE